MIKKLIKICMEELKNGWEICSSCKLTHDAISKANKAKAQAKDEAEKARIAAAANRAAFCKAVDMLRPQGILARDIFYNALGNCANAIGGFLPRYIYQVEDINPIVPVKNGATMFRFRYRYQHRGNLTSSQAKGILQGEIDMECRARGVPGLTITRLCFDVHGIAHVVMSWNQQLLAARSRSIVI